MTSFLFLFHIMEHFLQIKIFVVDEMLIANSNHKWHAGKLNNVRLITRRKKIATRIRNNVPLHAARPFWRAKSTRRDRALRPESVTSVIWQYKAMVNHAQISPAFNAPFYRR